MGVLGYKQLTITAEHADKKRCTPLLLEKCIHLFYGLSILYHSYPLVEDVTDRELDRIGRVEACVVGVCLRQYFLTILLELE